MELTPPGHPGLAVHLFNLGLALHDRFKHGGDAADLDAAIGCWQQASQALAGEPQTRLMAARHWGDAAAGSGRMEEATEGYRAAVATAAAGGLAWPGSRDKGRRIWRSGEPWPLTRRRAPFSTGRPELAVELLEQSRSVLWSQALSLRSDLSRLAQEAPDLAQRLDNIRRILDSPASEEALLPSEAADSSAHDAGNQARHRQDAADLRRRMARDWDDVLAQVHALPGFGHFLAAHPLYRTGRCSRGGPRRHHQRQPSRLPCPDRGSRLPDGPRYRPA